MSIYTVPPPVADQVNLLGQRIRTARLRRGWSAADLAGKAGINRNTLTALELGKPGVSLGVTIAVLWALGLDKTLGAIADPEADAHGKALEAARRPQRVGRVRRVSGAANEYDF